MISIVTINKGNAAGLRMTMESVLTQTGTDIEYIVIDGGSDDDSVSVIKEYAPHLAYWVSEMDEGIYQAINKGLQQCRGSLIGLIHSGDSLLPGVLEKVLPIHESHPEAILYGAIKTFRNGHFDEIWGWNSEKLKERMLPHPASFVPRTIYERLGYYDESYRIAADYEAFLRYRANDVEFRFIDLIVANFPMDGISNRDEALGRETEAVQKKYGLYKAPTARQRLKHQLKTMFGRFLD